MREVLRLSFLIVAIVLIECKVYDRCELAQELRFRFDVVSEEEIAAWVCIAQHQSSFNTAAVGAGGYYGLFQIGEEFWCEKGAGTGKECAVPCNKLIDDNISDDFECNKIIYDKHQQQFGNGFHAWTTYKTHCSDGKALGYIDGCFENFITRTPAYVESNFIRNSHTDAPTRINLPVRTDGHRARARIYDRCELAQELYYKHNMPMEQVPMWVCIADRESKYNTSAIGTSNADGSADHGLFQISDIYWCSPPGKGWVCGLSCSKLEDDDITDDVQCMKKIYDEHQRLSGDGFNAWTVYNPYCKGQAAEYIRDCFEDEGSNEVLPRPGIFAPNPPKVLKPFKDYGSAQQKRAKIYDRCELAQELVYQHNIAIEKVATWVCIAQHESNFNTSAVGRLSGDGSEDHGLFQISDIYWCSPPGKGWVCGLSCAQLEDDDITDDVECMKKIYEEHQGLSGDGFNAWTVYRSYCYGNVDKYIRGCFNEDLNFVIPSSHRPTIVTTTQPSYDINRKTNKVYDRCELAQELVYKHDIPMDQVATWVCIADKESSFNTSAVGRLNADGSEDHGLFQISDIYWCSPPGKGWVCGLSCAQLEDDDITDDVQCMKKIYEEHQGLSGDGFNAWTVYRPLCKGKSDRYIQGCFNRPVVPQAPIISVVKPANDDSLSLIQITDRPSGHLTQVVSGIKPIKNKPVLPDTYRPLIQINKQPPTIAPSLIIQEIENLITQTPDPVQQNVLVTQKPSIQSIFDKKPEYQSNYLTTTARPQYGTQSQYPQEESAYYLTDRPLVRPPQKPAVQSGQYDNKVDYIRPSVQSTVRPQVPTNKPVENRFGSNSFSNQFDSVWEALKPGSQLSLYQPTQRPQTVSPLENTNFILSEGGNEQSNIPIAPSRRPVENHFYQTYVEPTERPATLRPGPLSQYRPTTSRPEYTTPRPIETTPRPTTRPPYIPPTVRPQYEIHNYYQTPIVRPATTLRPHYGAVYQSTVRPQYEDHSVYERPTLRPQYQDQGVYERPTIRPTARPQYQGVYERPTVRPQYQDQGFYERPTVRPPVVTTLRPQYETFAPYQRPTARPQAVTTLRPQYGGQYDPFRRPTIRPQPFTTLRPQYQDHSVYQVPTIRPPVITTARPLYGDYYSQSRPTVGPSIYSTTQRPTVRPPLQFSQGFYQPRPFEAAYVEQHQAYQPPVTTTFRPPFNDIQRVEHRFEPPVRAQSQAFNIFDFYLHKYGNLNTYHTTARPLNFQSVNRDFVQPTTQPPYINQERFPTQQPYQIPSSTPHNPFSVFGIHRGSYPTTARPSYYSTTAFTTQRPQPTQLHRVDYEYTTQRPQFGAVEHQTSRPLVFGSGRAEPLLYGNVENYDIRQQVDQYQTPRPIYQHTRIPVTNTYDIRQRVDQFQTIRPSYQTTTAPETQTVDYDIEQIDDEYQTKPPSIQSTSFPESQTVHIRPKSYLNLFKRPVYQKTEFEKTLPEAEHVVVITTKQPYSYDKQTTTRGPKYLPLSNATMTPVSDGFTDIVYATSRPFQPPSKPLDVSYDTDIDYLRQYSFNKDYILRNSFRTITKTPTAAIRPTKLPLSTASQTPNAFDILKHPIEHYVNEKFLPTAPPLSSQVTVKPFTYNYVQQITKKPQQVSVFSQSPQFSRFSTTVKPFKQAIFNSNAPKNSFDLIFNRLQNTYKRSSAKKL